MRINITNYRGCREAAVTGGPILIVGGRNGNGKTSLLEGVALSVTRWAVPQGMPKKDAGDLLYTNDEGMRAAKGMVSVFLDEGAVHAVYPKGDVQEDGKLKVTPVAAGLVKLPLLGADKLAIALSSIVDSAPTLDDLLKACKAKGISAEVAGSIWKKVEKDGWDAAFAHSSDRGKLLKQEWQGITGQRWGSAIGESWRPNDWDDAIAEDTTTDEDIAALRDKVSEAEKAAAFDEGVMAALREDIEALPARDKAAQQKVIEAETALVELRAAEDLRSKLPNPDESGHDMPCPHCGAFVRLDRENRATTKLVKAEESKHKSTDLERMRRDIAAADGTLANKRTAYTNAKAALVAANEALTRSKNAVGKVDDAVKAREAGEVQSVADATLAYNEAKNRVAKREAYLQAASKHATIVGNAAIQEILAPEGLRATVLQRGLESFNREHLAPLCGLADWPLVMIESDLRITWGGRDWRFLSAAESWMVQAILQIAVARADGSQMVILDGADILDSRNRNGLFSILPEIGIEALVGMTYNNPALIPDLAAAEMGARFWIENGQTKAVTA